MSRFPVRADGVGHRFGHRRVLRDATLELLPGLTGLLGPNGAGKSTLMKLLATALPLQTGTIRYGGQEINRQTRQSIRAGIGYLPQRFQLMEWETLRRNVEFAAWAHGVSRKAAKEAADRALSAVDLLDRARERARGLSGGMRQRLGLACVIVHDPAVLILDEPTVGLDPGQRLSVRQVLERFAERSVVLVSTHLVEDLDTSADRVLVMDEGRMVFDDSMIAFRECGSGSGQGESSLERSYFAVLKRQAGA